MTHEAHDRGELGGAAHVHELRGTPTRVGLTIKTDPHFVAPNPWVIIGVCPIPHEQQFGLL